MEKISGLREHFVLNYISPTLTTLFLAPCSFKNSYDLSRGTSSLSRTFLTTIPHTDMAHSLPFVLCSNVTLSSKSSLHQITSLNHHLHFLPGFIHPHSSCSCPVCNYVFICSSAVSLILIEIFPVSFTSCIPRAYNCLAQTILVK